MFIIGVAVGFGVKYAWDTYANVPVTGATG